MDCGTIELASWSGLSYYMVDQDESQLLVRVVNQKGKKAIFTLETGTIKKSELETDELQKAQRMIRDNKRIFLEYWSEIRGKAKA